jgi:putative membrane protein
VIWIANILVALVALLHLYFLVLEMFLWTKPLGLKTFQQTQQKADDSAVLAANQGLYNGFLAAGLIWGLVHPVAGFGFEIKVFFLLCVIVAGLYGGPGSACRIGAGGTVDRIKPVGRVHRSPACCTSGKVSFWNCCMPSM